ncbi:Probable NAD(P)H dehydrogenase (quinone) FQR1-like 3 [Linum perenne]
MILKPLLEADMLLFGFPSRFGVMAAQCKAFFDSTEDLWATQSLAGKPAGIFWSTGFHGGGQELTANGFGICCGDVIGGGDLVAEWLQRSEELNWSAIDEHC